MTNDPMDAVFRSIIDKMNDDIRKAFGVPRPADGVEHHIFDKRLHWMEYKSPLPPTTNMTRLLDEIMGVGL